MPRSIKKYLWGITQHSLVLLKTFPFSQQTKKERVLQFRNLHCINHASTFFARLKIAESTSSGADNEI